MRCRVARGQRLAGRIVEQQPGLAATTGAGPRRKGLGRRTTGGEEGKQKRMSLISVKGGWKTFCRRRLREARPLNPGWFNAHDEGLEPSAEASRSASRHASRFPGSPKGLRCRRRMPSRQELRAGRRAVCSTRPRKPVCIGSKAKSCVEDTPATSRRRQNRRSLLLHGGLRRDGPRQGEVAILRSSARLSIAGMLSADARIRPTLGGNQRLAGQDALDLHLVRCRDST